MRSRAKGLSVVKEDGTDLLSSLKELIWAWTEVQSMMVIICRWDRRCVSVKTGWETLMEQTGLLRVRFSNSITIAECWDGRLLFVQVFEPILFLVSKI